MCLKFSWQNLLKCQILSIYVFIIWFSVPAFSQKCERINSCSCQFENGSIIDLSSLASSDGPRFKNVTPVQAEPFRYFYNPCTSFKLGNTGDCSDGVAVCQVVGTKDYYDCGDQDKTSFVWNPGKNALVLTYHGRGARFTEVTLICSDDDGDAKLKVIGETTKGSKQYEMELTSRCACPDQCLSGGLSFGSALVIIFFICLFFYLFLGIVYNHLVRGAHGWELIPNYEFWADFPLLVRDGCVYVCSGCRSETSYERI